MNNYVSTELRQGDWRSDEPFDILTPINEQSQNDDNQNTQRLEDIIDLKVPSPLEVIPRQSPFRHRFRKNHGDSKSSLQVNEYIIPDDQPPELQQPSWNSDLSNNPSMDSILTPSGPKMDLHLPGNQEINSAQYDFSTYYFFNRIDDNIPVLTRKARNAVSEPEITLNQEAKNESNSETSLSLEKSASPSRNETEAQIALDLLQEGEKRLNTSSYPSEAVLILGNTGSGKSTLTQFMTGDGENLISFEDVSGSGDFIINDTLGRISNASTITSWTVYPESMVDIISNTTFYDCPGFSDTRGVAHDITTTYFTKELLKRLDKVKLIFTINHSSVRIGVDRQDFMTFAEHVTSVVKDVEKYNDSIALIVTKVENQYRKGVLVPDEKVVESVAGFLKIVKAELHRKMQNNDTFTEMKPKTIPILKFIDVLLQHKEQSYPKIGIFRRPDEAGPLARVNSLLNSRKVIEKVIYLNTDYAACNESDFGQTISCKSKNSLHILVKKIKERISLDVEKLQEEIVKHFSSIQEQLNDFQYLHELFQRAYNTFAFTHENATSPMGFVHQVSRNLQDLNVSHSDAHLTSILKYDDYLKFCSSYGAPLGNSSDWIYKFKPAVKNLNDTESYYQFLVQLSDVLFSYDVQKDSSGFFNFVSAYFKRSNTSDNLEKRVVLRSLISALQNFKMHYENNVEISESQINNIDQMDIDPVKFQKLESLMEFALKPNVRVFCDKSNNKLTAKGHIVRLADVSSGLSVCKVPFIEIFALEKVIFDVDLDLRGSEAQVSVIAPIWETVDVRLLNLDGAEGKFEEPRPNFQPGWTRDGNWSLWGAAQETSIESKGELRNPGSAGNPGPPGSPAGSFFGIGKKFKNSQFLTISSVGGRGGPGQEGEAGDPGKDGTKPGFIKGDGLSRPEDRECYTSHRFYSETPTQVCTVHGLECSDGGNGTDGGAGGKGGKSGQIRLIGLSQSDAIQQIVTDGQKGLGGIGGKGGKAGTPAKIITYVSYCVSPYRYNSECPTTYRNIEEDSRKESSHKCDAGRSGTAGKNQDGIQEPRESRKLQGIPGIIHNFKEFARGDSHGSVRQTQVQTFLDEYLGKFDPDEMVVIADDTTFANIS